MKANELEIDQGSDDTTNIEDVVCHSKESVEKETHQKLGKKTNVLAS